MHKIIYYCVIVVLISSCEKASDSQRLMSSDTACYQGKYLNGIHCTEMGAIQIIAPDSLAIDATYNAEGGQAYPAAFGIIVPEEFRDGQVFYFTIDSLQIRPNMVDNCFYVPKYVAVLRSISRDPCPPETEIH